MRRNVDRLLDVEPFQHVSREKFLAMLLTGPLLKANAAVVLSGDGESRLAVAHGAFITGGAQCILVSGGVDRPPFSRTADYLRSKLMGMGVHPDAVLTEPDSLHTADQARRVVAIAVEKEWRRLLLITSSFHMPRAFLSFVKALNDAQKSEAIQVVPLPATHSPWSGIPEGETRTRLELLSTEFEKIDRYQGDVATYEEGLKYLQWWEGR